ncbi:hypothetical protein FAI40_00825 [Acetobacteraceae bacterium]|nr:hypothetical protein FAI40_00825 [Acetobacteraceae bacterium]
MLKTLFKSAFGISLSICFCLPSVSRGVEIKPTVPLPPKSDQSYDKLIPENSPWRQMNIFAQLTGVWEKTSQKMSGGHSNIPAFAWHSDQGANLTFFLLSQDPLAPSQTVSLEVSSDFFQCDGDPLRLWFTNQEYIDFERPICNEKNLLVQKTSSSEDKKLIEVISHGGFPVILSQAKQAILVRSLLAPKEITAINWYRSLVKSTSVRETK